MGESVEAELQRHKEEGEVSRRRSKRQKGEGKGVLGSSTILSTQSYAVQLCRMTQRVYKDISCIGNSFGVSGKFMPGVCYFILLTKTSVKDLFIAEDKYKPSSVAPVFPHWVFSGTIVQK